MPDGAHPSAGYAALGACIAAALGLAVAAYLVAGFAWDQIVGYRTPYASAPVPMASAGPRLTQRTVLVIVDGLRLDASRRMQALGTLRQFGTDLVLSANQPSLSYPGWTDILSGAPPRVSGVTSNGFSGRVPVETLLDTAIAAGRRTVVVGPTDFAKLYGADRATAHYYRDVDRKTHAYLSSDLVLHAVALVRQHGPSFVLVHLPDVDDAGHDFGGASPAYLAAAQKVDTDLSVLVNQLQDGHTTFVVTADHGHTDAGGHGGWEPDVIDVPAVLAGPGVGLGSAKAAQDDLAPTVAAISGLPTPREAFGRLLTSVLTSAPVETVHAESDQRSLFLAHYLDIIAGLPASRDVTAERRQLAAYSEGQVQGVLLAADQARLTVERNARLPYALMVAGAALLALGVVGVFSWRALVAAAAGAVTYYVVYDGLYFGVHRLAWSLSVVNSEDRLNAFFAARIAEAALAGLIAAAVAGAVYPLLRRRPRPASGGFLPGWLALGPATVLVTQATLVAQTALYFWTWGVLATWILPDFRAAFKFDLDLIQLVGLGIAAILSPLVTRLVGRYHPRVARPAGRPTGAAPATPAPATGPGE